ncbi:DUF3549 family protein [Parashewanella curva]|uniref:DUF3549 family protein n=1 Tax=Parashewanella curva TaxID=2338552 RepID=A0A3L8PSK3_9GAMM|nr:DUF3549 family protein [Parashewanella curva]RLV57799.1 DUF3549 family protein [Parashewanella curva]
MTEITTLSQFLTTAQTQFQIYDLGRRVQHIDMMAFHQIESLKTPYPYPIQGHAQFAVVFWNEDKQPYIWFIKLALDERGLFVPAARSQFIQMILEALGRDPTQPLTEQQQQALANNPFSFKPSQEKLAVFNALVRKQLGLPASSQYESAIQYLSGQMPKENWEYIGLQGIADVCVRAKQLDHEQHILNGLENSAIEVQGALCQCLEHMDISDDIAKLIYDAFVNSFEDLTLPLLRAVASHKEYSQKAVMHLIKQRKLSLDSILITIAARNWSVLSNEQIRLAYLEALALQSQAFFNQVFADLVAIPQLRNAMLGELRNPQRSETLSKAIGGLFKATSH